jgi:hypothetical protein
VIVAQPINHVYARHFIEVQRIGLCGIHLYVSAHWEVGLVGVCGSLYKEFMYSCYCLLARSVDKGILLQATTYRNQIVP